MLVDFYGKTKKVNKTSPMDPISKNVTATHAEKLEAHLCQHLRSIICPAIGKICTQKKGGATRKTGGSRG